MSESVSSADLRDVYPALDDPCSDVRPELSVLQHCVDHAGRDSIELRNGGTDGGSAVLVVLLVPLRPDRAQTMMGYDLFEQHLKHHQEKPPPKSRMLVRRRRRNGM